jgi:hypothetical protein
MSSLSIEEATEIARAASEAAHVAAEVAKAAAAQLAELEEQQIAGQLAEAEAQKQKAKDAAQALVLAEFQMNAVSEALKGAKTVCDNFLKDSSGIEDKIAHALEIGKTYQDVLKQQTEANRLLSEAKKADLPFQVPRLREELAALQAELAEVEKKEADKQKEIEDERDKINKSHGSYGSGGTTATLHSLSLHQHMNIEKRINLTKQLQQKTSELHAAEVAAGLRFMNKHAPHHEMILRAAMNGGTIRGILCSCGSSAGWWGAASPYPPKCSRDTPQCGNIGW